jgi:hypothetical protein
VKGKKLERWEIPIDDKDAIRMGSKRDLVGIFQFENPSVRSVVDAVGMDCLDDVSAITSLIRPGPRNMGMDIEYARRKHGEPYTEVEILRKLLVKTHSTMVYQEDTMKISRELAGFTMAEANRLRRACGKKKADVMAGMRALFMKGAQKKIDEGAITQDEVETVWQKIAAFAKYGFCLSWTTVVRTPRGNKMISELKVGDKVKTPSCLGGRFANVSAVLDQGERELFEVTLESGKRIECTMDHRFLCGDGKKRPLSAILEGGQTIVCEEEQ